MNDNSASKPVWFRGETKLEHTPQMLLRMAAEEDLDDVCIIGVRKDKTIYLDHSDKLKRSDVNWLLDKIKLGLFTV